MEHGGWDPICTRPDDLVWPVRVGAKGLAGLTWEAANGPRFERVGCGLYVPADRGSSVEQRILEAGARLPADGSRGCVTGWAGLRWRGAAYYDGRLPNGEGELPVEIVSPIGIHHREWPGTVVRRRWLSPDDREVIDGLPVASVQRALFDEIRRRDELWSAVQAVDMTAAARLISVWLFASYIGESNSWTGAPLAREACSLAVDESRSPRETWLRLVASQLADPLELLVNEPVYDLAGNLIGIPDLFDPEAGVAFEYSGEVHLGHRQRRRDVVRTERFRGHGIEVVEVVRGDSRTVAYERCRQGRRRGLWLPPAARTWTLDRPAWDPAPETLDDYLARIGLVASLTCQ